MSATDEGATRRAARRGVQFAHTVGVRPADTLRPYLRGDVRPEDRPDPMSDLVSEVVRDVVPKTLRKVLREYGIVSDDEPEAPRT